MNPQRGERRIGWTDYTWNPVTGCRGPGGDGEHCHYCYAERLAEGRLKHMYPYGFEPTFWPDRLDQPQNIKKPSRIFIGSMGDLFGDWDWRLASGMQIGDGTFADCAYRKGFIESDRAVRYVLDACKDAPQHTYQFLTRWPDQMIQHDLSRHWAGVTIGDQPTELVLNQIADLAETEARVRFVSIEPFVSSEHDSFPLGLECAEVWDAVDWAIIGAQTGPQARGPSKGALYLLIRALDIRYIPVFLKSNLKQYWPYHLRQEWPRGELLPGEPKPEHSPAELLKVDGGGPS